MSYAADIRMHEIVNAWDDNTADRFDYTISSSGDSILPGLVCEYKVAANVHEKIQSDESVNRQACI
jgi:hypothetical protein